MGDRLNPETAFIALEELLQKINNDLWPEYSPRLNMTLRSFIQWNKEGELDKENQADDNMETA